MYAGCLDDVPPGASTMLRLVHATRHTRVNIIQSATSRAIDLLLWLPSTALYTFITARTICIAYPHLTSRLHMVANKKVEGNHHVGYALSQWTLLGARGFSLEWWGSTQVGNNRLVRAVGGRRFFFDRKCLVFEFTQGEIMGLYFTPKWNWSTTVGPLL